MYFRYNGSKWFSHNAEWTGEGSDRLQTVTKKTQRASNTTITNRYNKQPWNESRWRYQAICIFSNHLSWVLIHSCYMFEPTSGGHNILSSAHFLVYLEKMCRSQYLKKMAWNCFPNWVVFWVNIVFAEILGEFLLQ